MSNCQDQPRRTSSRSTKGTPPARYQQYVSEMSVNHSPKSDTPAKSQQRQPQLQPMDGTTHVNTINPPSQLQHQKTAANSPAGTSKPVNEVGEFMKQMRVQMVQMQRQMQVMQSEYIASTKKMQAQLVNTAKQVETQLANQMTSTSALPTSTLPQPPSNMPEPILPTSQPSLPPPNQSQYQPPQNLLQQPPQLSPLQQQVYQPTPQYPPPSRSINSDMSVHNSYPQSFISVPHKKIYPLPTFSGLPEEWQTFYEAYESTTAEFGYNSLHNIMRLRDAIKGRARETVESLLGNSANVDTIIRTLLETFGRPEQLIRSQIEKVRAIPPLANDNLEALVNFANKISNMATFVKNVKGDHHLSNPSLLSELVAKLSTSRQMQWAEKCLQLQQPATIVDFAEWLSVLRRLANIVHDTLPSTSTNAASNRRHFAATAPPPNRKYVNVTVSQCPVCKGECTNIKHCTEFLNMSIDKRWNTIKGLKICFCCLKRGHQVKFCHTKRRCGVNDCPKPHNNLLHSTLSQSQPEPATEPTHLSTTGGTQNNRTVTSEAQRPQTERRNCHAAHSPDNVLFQILPITLYGQHKTISTYAFIDDGANVSMLDLEIARELELHGEPEHLELQWLNTHRVTQKTEKIRVTISGVGQFNRKYLLSNVYVSSDMSLPVQSCHIAHFMKSQKSDKIANLNMRDYSNVQPKMILSLTHSFLTVPIETPTLLSEFGPIVSTTRLGAVIYGPIPGEEPTNIKRALHVRKCVYQNDVLKELSDMMRGYFDVETLGTKIPVKPIKSKEDERAMGILETNTKQVNGRYECSLLWREDVRPIPDSYNMALNRLYSVERKMAKDSEYKMEYCDKIADYVKKGYCRKLSDEEKSIMRERTFYLPHFGVLNPNKKGIRLVFDAAAEVMNFSLNKALLPGPDINNSLISILFKFRESPIAVCGDIQEMFHQIAIARKDQDSQRFLWRDGNPEQPVDTYVMERLIFGATCSPTIAQYVKNKNATKYIEKSPRAVHGIIERHYVDDYVDCFETEDEALNVVREVVRIHKSGGFHLRNIISNSERVAILCGNNPGNGENSGNFLFGDSIERVLGIHWAPKTDDFCFHLRLAKVDKNILNFTKVPTKREMLGLNMSVYDPYGFLCDFMVTSKVLMQKVWKCGVSWDEQLPSEIYSQWKYWLEQLSRLVEFKIPRCYAGGFSSSNVDLHVFVDASEEAMAVVAYWRVVSVSGVKVMFVMGKTSCAPTRYHTIPKLELQAAVMGVRMKEAILKNHLCCVNNVFFWSDSFTVIQWIRSDHRRYKQYVANRVAEILDGSSIEQWRWCPGNENTADEGTRSKLFKPYEPEGRWKNGPTFLLKAESYWPSEVHNQMKKDESGSELRSKHRVLKAETGYGMGVPVCAKHEA
ncbi:uncharacterized protein LOC131997912 [Stomoxys calcitrans]|uniref:uncharacterized protein LOC131997631 n=1 Tax=Stomoxys calcitrans TaxID=35570 RepID=UPI0027E293C5|nr:uncharacterized protein LOC131997631 [Stomoxys calcitrans]XP_059225767.1 uncharacterized protein LOC131997912 [Stomoxys calcitrans]